MLEFQEGIPKFEEKKRGFSGGFMQKRVEHFRSAMVKLTGKLSLIYPQHGGGLGVTIISRKAHFIYLYNLLPFGVRKNRSLSMI